jgi:hypothetical protein
MEHCGHLTVGIYFSDVFEVAPRLLERYGAFNVSVVNDLPLFIDPFLLFNSRKPKYRKLHDEIIAYLSFLRDKSAGGNVGDGLLKAWYTFKEVHQNWFGFSRAGNRGSGLGLNFGRALNRNLNTVFSSFGNEKVTRSSHLEKGETLPHRIGRRPRPHQRLHNEPHQGILARLHAGVRTETYRPLVP